MPDFILVNKGFQIMVIFIRNERRYTIDYSSRLLA